MKNFKELQQSLTEATGKPWWKVVKSPAGMPKGHTLIQWGNRYFCFAADPNGVGMVLGRKATAAIWKCDRSGKRNPNELPVWDIGSGGLKWDAEEAMDAWLDDYADPYDALEEATRVQESAGLTESTPGKPETMAQKHARLQGYDGKGGTDYAFKSQKRYLAFVQEVARDWHSGDMALSRMESLVTSDLAWLVHGSSWGDGTDPDVILMNALAAEFRKQVKSAGLEPTTRLGKGGGFNPAMGKITPNQIGRFFDLVVDFVKNDWTKIEARIKGKNP